MMINIASSISYDEFDEIKGYKLAYSMWKKVKEIYGGDDNVKILRGQFDQMKMREDENIAEYVERIKASVSAIRASGGIIDDKIVVSKVIRTLLPIYAIRVSAIQEARCDPNCIITLDSLVGRLTTFELDNFDNYVPSSKNFESAFKAKLSLKDHCKKWKATSSKTKEETKESLDNDLEVVESLLAKKYSKSRRKYKDKIPLICFSCKEIGHITARCPNKE